jgi:hypothetical protein
MNPESEDFIQDPGEMSFDMNTGDADSEGEQANETREGEPVKEDDIERHPMVEDLPDAEHHLAVEQGLKVFRNILSGVDDYTLFASTAMYLNGKRLAERGVSLGEEMERPPGDIDIAVFSREAMNRLTERIHGLPGAHINNEGRPKRIQGEDAMKLSGTVPVRFEVNGVEQQAEYEFEVYLNSSIVTPDVTRNNIRKAGGFNVLNLEGLRRQYERNLRVEGKIDELVEQISQFLESDEPHAQEFVREVTSADRKADLSEQSLEIINSLGVEI